MLLIIPKADGSDDFTFSGFYRPGYSMTNNRKVCSGLQVEITHMLTDAYLQLASSLFISLIHSLSTTCF